MPELDFRRLFDATPTPYLVLDPALVIVEVNQAYLAATSTKREAILGRGVFEVFPDNPSDPDADGMRNLDRSLRAVLATGHADTMALQRFDIVVGEEARFEERYWSPVNTPVLDESGAITHIIHRVEDVTEYVRLRRSGQQEQTRADRAEGDLFVRGRELQELNQKLREQQGAKDRFIATLSHELRNPLAALRAASELLALDSAAGHPALAVLERQINAMVRMTDDLLDATKALTGRLELVRTPLDLRSVVTTAVQDVQPEFTRANRRLRMSLPATPVPVDGDRVRLAQMLGNLLNNGRKYTRQGGRVTVALREEGGFAELTVVDNGIGFDPAVADALFDVFVRAVRVEGSDAGLGLGLPIVRTIAELHQGSVRATSDGPGLGARFTIRLPLARSDSGMLAAPPPTRSAPAALKILIIEDNVDLATAYQALLEYRGHHVEVAHTGQDGLAAALEKSFDLVLSDLGLPDISGYDVARELRRVLVPGRTRLVAVSGFGQRADQQASTDAGFDAHLTKPVTTATLDALLTQWS